MLESPLKSPLSSVINRRRRAGGAAPSAMAAMKSKIIAGVADVGLLVIGDSTGDQSYEWVYLLAQWFSTEYPTHSVDYLLYNWPGSAYDAPVSIATGSGARKITVWNCSIGSSQPMQVAGDRFHTAVVDTSPDLFILSHGHNMSSGDSNVLTMDSGYSSMLESVLYAKPGIGLGLLLQNPNRDSTIQNGRIAAVQALAASRGDASVIDAHQKFIALGKAGSLYNDAMHPSASGSALIRDAFTETWTSAGGTSTPPSSAWVSESEVNLLPNGTFSDWTAAAPAGWAITGSVTKDLVLFETGTYSAKIDSVDVSTSLRFTFTAGAALTAMLGNPVSLAVRMRRSGSGLSAVGRCELRAFMTSGQTASSTFDHGSTLINAAQDGWYWNILRGFVVPADTTSLRIAIYGHPSTLASPSQVWIDRAILVQGEFPRDALP